MKRALFFLVIAPQPASLKASVEAEPARLLPSDCVLNLTAGRAVRSVRGGMVRLADKTEPTQIGQQIAQVVRAEDIPAMSARSEILFCTHVPYIGLIRLETCCGKAVDDYCVAQIPESQEV